jgi:ATP-binding protein involved in chromosome partitioning
MPLTESQILDKLKTVKYPGFSRDIVSFGLVKGVHIEGANVGVRISITTADHAVPETIRKEATAAIKTIPGVAVAEVLVETQAPLQAAAQAGGLPQNKIPGIKHIIAVASGKGGVGKSTVAANLATALGTLGNRVGLCDCDIYGPSIALMFGSKERPMATEDNQIIPIVAHGIKLMSMGFLLDDAAPAILRGPMVTRYTQQFLRSVVWGELDYLILDLPPGTGDIQLTIVQTVALSGAVIVTTPQEVALIDARKAATMFEKVNVPVLGIIENMSYFLCPSDGKRYDIFGRDGGKKEAERLGVGLLAQIPIEIEIRETGDQGHPIVLRTPQAVSSQQIVKAAKLISQNPKVA